VTLDLEASRIAPMDKGACPEGLKAGQMVTVKAKLPRHLDDLPSVLSPRSVLTLGPML
jgi:hypothetical protein